MKYIIKDCFWQYIIGFKRPQTLEKIKERLQSKLWKMVYNWELIESTYRTIYEYLHYCTLEELNEILNYELWIKILIYNN